MTCLTSGSALRVWPMKAGSPHDFSTEATPTPHNWSEQHIGYRQYRLRIRQHLVDPPLFTARVSQAYAKIH